jgi:hypothetical protein
MLRDPLDLFWNCADSPAAVPTLTGDDVAELPPLALEYLQALGLLRPGDTVGHVVCRNCEEDHIVEITRVAYPDEKVRFFAKCPTNGRIEIPRERLLQWTVGFGPVLAEVMAALGAPGKPKEVIPGRVWDLGRTALIGQSRPLWAVRGMSWPDAAIVGKSVPKGRSPVVFVLGQRPEEGILDVPHDCIIELRTVVTLQSHTLSVSADSIKSQLSVNPAESIAKKVKKRSSRKTLIASIKKALRKHLMAARDKAFSSSKRSGIPELLPRPTQEQLAKQLKVDVSSISRAINDTSDREISFLWEIANDVDQVMNFKR